MCKMHRYPIPDLVHKRRSNCINCKLNGKIDRYEPCDLLVEYDVSEDGAKSVTVGEYIKDWLYRKSIKKLS